MERKLVVLGIPWDIDSDGLKDYMLKFGDLEDCIVMKDRSTGRSRGFGYVTFASAEDAKGKLYGGKEIAVKRLSSNYVQGKEEFMNEIKLISKLQHKNLVRLLGCCIDGEDKLLVFEYMVNKNLKKKLEIDWPKRFNIIQGIARGLLYLNRDSFLRVVHRDLKVSNILLDEKMNLKISDFGLARMFQGSQSCYTKGRNETACEKGYEDLLCSNPFIGF